VSGLDELAAALAEPAAAGISPEIAALVSQAEELFKAGKSRQALGLLWRAEAVVRGRGEDAAAVLELAKRHEGHMKGRRQENDLRLLTRNLRSSAALATRKTTLGSAPISDAALKDPWSWTREPVTVALVIWAILCPIVTAVEFWLFAALGVSLSGGVALLAAIVLISGQAALAGGVAHRPARWIILLAGLALASTIVIFMVLVIYFFLTFPGY